MKGADRIAELREAGHMIGKTGKKIETQSLSTSSNLQVLSAILKKEQPVRTLEVGLALGASALTILDAHQTKGLGKKQVHYAIDPFQSTVWDNCGELNIAAAGKEDFFRCIQELSAIALPKLVEDGLEFGLIYVDGSHLFEDVFIDMFFSTKLLAPNGIILFDDSSDPHVRKVISFVRKNMAFALKEIDLREFINFFGTSDLLRYRIARVLNRTQLTAFRLVGNSVRPWNSTFVDF